MTEQSDENDQSRKSGLKTCPKDVCTGYGRTLWPSHERCPWCWGPLVPYVATPPGKETP